MFWFLYEMLFFVGLLVTGPYYLFRMRRRGGYAKNFTERFGFYSGPVQDRLSRLNNPLWIHAVSVGEVQLAFSLIEALQKEHPGLDLILSTTTSTGYALAKEKENSKMAVVYYPMDSRLFFRKIHRLARPKALLLMEAELWPNHLLYCSRRGVALALINARMSDRSFRRYENFRFLFGSVFAAFDLITLQSEADRERVLRIGARKESLVVIGSLKYGAAGAVDEVKRRKLLDDLGFLRPKPVLIGASTHAGEEVILIETWRELKKNRPDLALVLAPRHVERKPELVRLLEESEVSFVCRSSPGSGADVVLLDTTGDLRHLYELATIVFIGKSLCGQGGQNLMEPAWYGKAIVFGPHMQNFRPIVADFLQAGAAVQVNDRDALVTTLGNLLNGAGVELGKKAKALMDSRRDVIQRTLDQIEPLVGVP